MVTNHPFIKLPYIKIIWASNVRSPNQLNSFSSLRSKLFSLIIAPIKLTFFFNHITKIPINIKTWWIFRSRCTHPFFYKHFLNLFFVFFLPTNNDIIRSMKIYMVQQENVFILRVRNDQIRKSIFGFSSFLKLFFNLISIKWNL